MITPSAIDVIIRNRLREEFNDVIEIEFSQDKYPVGVIVEKVDLHHEYGVVGLCFDPYKNQVFLADLSGYRVEEIVRLPKMFSKVLAVDLVYDYAYDTYFLYVCQGYAKNYLYRVSADFTKVLASYETNLAGGDRGALVLASMPTYRLIYLSDDVAEVWGDIPSDTSKMPSFTSTGLPLRAEAKSYATYAGERGKAYAHDGSLPLTRWGDEWVGLIALHSGTEDLHTQAIAFYTYDPEKGHMSCCWSPVILATWSMLGKKWQAYTYFKHITDALGYRFHLVGYRMWKGVYRPFLVRFPEWLLWELGRKRICTLWLDTQISAGSTTAAIPGWGWKTIHFTSDTAGDLTVYIDAVGRNDWKAIYTSTGVTSDVVQTTYSGMRMRLGFSAAAKVTAHVIVEM